MRTLLSPARPPAAAPPPVGARFDIDRTAQPRAAFDPAVWFAIIAFVFYSSVTLYGIGGRLLSITYPIGSVIVAGLCYFRSPTTYVGFAMWSWFLTPFVRRVYDMTYGFHATSTLLLAPLAVSSFAIITVLRRRRMLRGASFIPFVIAISALTYAYMIGIIRQSPGAATYDLFNWLTPICFGMHLALEWRRFPQLRLAVTRGALWGLLVTATYGIWQFVDPPIWDRVWVVNSEMFSIGAPMPFLIRVFSTLNAPGPFSVMLIFSLFIGLAAPQAWRILPLALGLVALILTKGRSAWASFLFGAFVMQARQPLRSLPKQWVVIIGVFMLAFPLIIQPRILSGFTRRVATITELEQDNSFQARSGFAQVALSSLAQNPTGSGLGGFGGAAKLLSNTKHGFALDSGPLEIYAVMGWIGGSLFMMSLAAILLQIIRTRKVRFEPVTSAAVSAVVALLLASLFGNIFNNASGFFFWSALGLASAGRSYADAADLIARYGNHPSVLARINGDRHQGAA